VLHTRPQTPQLRTSIAVLVQRAPHIVVPGGHDDPPEHTPATHVCPALHARPHAPQLAESVVVFTHDVPHIVVPVGQVVVVEQIPPVQV
jgi:hypothetical protein